MGIRLYYLRTHKTDYTQKEMAQLLGFDRSAYTCYESGKAEPRISTVRKLAQIFDVSCDEIINPQLSEIEIADYRGFRRYKKRSYDKSGVT